MTNPWKNLAIVARLRELSIYSAAGAALKLSSEFFVYFSRNAVIGKRYRLGLRSTKPTIATKRRIAPKSVENLRLGRKKSQRRSPVAIIPNIAEFPEPAPLNVGFMKLANANCRWVCDGQGDDCLAIFCGHQIAPGFSYCPHHAARAYNVRSAGR